ncbi:39S ribosomal protein L42, mitochondrial, partial [Ophiophagus hannah]
MSSICYHGHSLKEVYFAFGNFHQEVFANCKVELAMTSDGKTIVCYHPSVDIPYEHTKPIPQLDPVTYKEETHDQVLKSKLEEKEVYKNEPTIETLSKMFYTTKHRWYPVGQYHTRRKKTSTPKDR